MILLSIRVPYECLRASGGRVSIAVIPAGIHCMERIDNPVGLAGAWLVLEGTRVGAFEDSFKYFIGSPGVDFGIYAVILVEDGMRVDGIS